MAVLGLGADGCYSEICLSVVLSQVYHSLYRRRQVAFRSQTAPTTKDRIKVLVGYVIALRPCFGLLRGSTSQLPIR